MREAAGEASVIDLGDVGALVGRAARLAGRRDRTLLGIVGAPGAGKSTVVAALIAGLAERGVPTAWVPMDGFHLADAQLERLGRLDRKGAIETFDGWGYVATLRRVLAEADRPVFVPAFERELEQPIAAGLVVEPGPALVITEGNYLLDEREPWGSVRELLDEAWFVEVDDAVRRERLVARHVAFGKSPEEATRWVAEVDEPNAAEVVAAGGWADLVVREAHEAGAGVRERGNRAAPGEGVGVRPRAAPSR